MAKKNILLKNKERLPREDAAAFLRQLADKLASGQVHFTMGTQEISLELPAQVTFEVKVDDKPKRKGTKRSLEIELEWYTGTDGEPPATLEMK